MKFVFVPTRSTIGIQYTQLNKLLVKMVVKQITGGYQIDILGDPYQEINLNPIN